MNLRKQFIVCLRDIVRYLTEEHQISDFDISKISLDHTPDLSFGHYACSAPMMLARVFKKKPFEIAQEIKSRLETSEMKAYIKNIQLVAPGFINLFLNERCFRLFFKQNFSIDEWLDSFLGEPEKDQKYHFEYVSANPTGPLNIVSARAAAVGDSICRVLKRTRKDVHREYYVNDCGNQVFLLGISLAVRYLQSKGLSLEMPENGYHGEYLKDVLKKIEETKELPEFLRDTENLNSYDKEKLDQWLNKAAESFSPLAVEILLETHKKDLEDFRVSFDQFFSEKKLHEGRYIDEVFEMLSKNGHVYEKENAFYFNSTAFGDDKDRILKRSDGRPTYFLSDIAYHFDKFKRGFCQIYDLWGPDHHGYIARLQGAMKALNCLKDDNKFEVLIVQQVNLIEDKKPIVMSKRLGKFHSMTDLTRKIPIDVCRYFFISRSQSQHLDFDLDKALDESPKNPVFYIQYAYARIQSIFKEVFSLPSGTVVDIQILEKEENISMILGSDPDFSEAQLNDWIFASGRDILLFQLLKFADEIDSISQNLEIQRMAAYLYELASAFTGFYHADENRILGLLKEKESQREGIFLLMICRITALVLKEGLSLLGIQAPRSM